VPLHILGLAKDPDDVVQADVFMLTDKRPALLSGPGVHLVQSGPADPSLLADLRSDRGMGWVAPAGWLSYLTVDAPAPSLTYDLAADVSSRAHPSPIAAALAPPRGQILTASTRAGSDGWWWTAGLGAAGLGILLAVPMLLVHRRRRRPPVAAA
jgi:hypothetical protein